MFSVEDIDVAVNLAPPQLGGWLMAFIAVLFIVLVFTAAFMWLVWIEDRPAKFWRVIWTVGCAFAIVFVCILFPVLYNDAWETYRHQLCRC